MAKALRDVVQGPPELKGLTVSELGTVMESLGAKRYRGQQLFDAMYIHNIASIDDVKVLPTELRQALTASHRLHSVELQTVQMSDDGTFKYLFRLYDGRQIESVLIPSELRMTDDVPRRRTLCVSTQVGCNLGCAFCATATLNLQRNLTAGEIVDQYLAVARHSGLEITNIVFMGMGEPMNNYENVMRAAEIFNDQRTGMAAPRRTTLSTAGVVPGIERMADEGRLIKLAVSLHATTQGAREQLMPIAKRWPLPRLMDALEYYYKKTRKKVTYEYIVFDGFNDSIEDVRRLARIAKRVPSKVNVIPFHDIGFTRPEGFAAELRPASAERFEAFLQELRNEGVLVLVRSSSGHDIDAACGQLALSEGDHA